MNEIVSDARNRAARVRLAVLDVDGVLTDGRLTFDERGGELKTFNVRDGLGVKLLMQAGIEVAVISARESRVVENRMRDLGVQHVHLGARDKLAVFEALLRELDMTAASAAYIGDDLVDLPVLACAGLAATVADADPRVIERAHWRSKAGGGAGAVREFCEFILAAQGRLNEIIEAHIDDTARDHDGAPP